MILSSMNTHFFFKYELIKLYHILVIVPIPQLTKAVFHRVRVFKPKLFVSKYAKYGNYGKC